MKRILTGLIILTIFLPSVLNARTYFICEEENKTILQKIATNITTNYDYVETFDSDGYGTVTFTVELNNLDKRIYIYEENSKRRYNVTSNKLTIGGLKPNQTLKFVIYGNDYGCDDELLTVFVILPPYNKYYKDELCTDKDYKICNRWVKADYTYDEFKKLIKSYETTEEDEEPVVVEENKWQQLFIKIVSFLNEYRLYIFLPPVLISLIIILKVKVFKKKEWKEIR